MNTGDVCSNVSISKIFTINMGNLTALYLLSIGGDQWTHQAFIPSFRRASGFSFLKETKECAAQIRICGSFICFRRTLKPFAHSWRLSTSEGRTVR